MDVILGIDIGGSTTKIVGLRTDGSIVSMLRVRADDQVTSLYGALGNYLTSNGLTLTDVRRIVLTGVGASYVEGDIYGLPTCKVDEFSASGTGALALSGQDKAVDEALSRTEQELVSVVRPCIAQARCEVIVGAVAYSSPADGIIDYAERHQCDLIVMGRRGLGKLRGMLGSVSSGVLANTDIPVLTVK